MCAGAVTRYLAYQGGKALYNGGWNQLKGAFSAIRFQSMRDTSGSNIVVLKDFEIILKPVMITPIQ